MQTLCLQIFKSPDEVLTDGCWRCHLSLRTGHVRPLKCHSVDAECLISTFSGSIWQLAQESAVSAATTRCYLDRHWYACERKWRCLIDVLDPDEQFYAWFLLRVSVGRTFACWRQTHFTFCLSWSALTPLLPLFLIMGLFFFFLSCDRFLDAGKSICMNCRVQSEMLLLMSNKRNRKSSWCMLQEESSAGSAAEMRHLLSAGANVAVPCFNGGVCIYLVGVTTNKALPPGWEEHEILL